VAGRREVLTSPDRGTQERTSGREEEDGTIDARQAQASRERTARERDGTRLKRRRSEEKTKDDEEGHDKDPTKRNRTRVLVCGRMDGLEPHRLLPYVDEMRRIIKKECVKFCVRTEFARACYNPCAVGNRKVDFRVRIEGSIQHKGSCIHPPYCFMQTTENEERSLPALPRNHGDPDPV